MTKLKSKKMSKSTFAVIIMAIAMVAMLAFGGTYAYFTAQASASSSVITLGKVQVTATEGTKFTADYSNVMPGDSILGDGVTLSKAESTEDVWVAVKVTTDNATLASALGISTAIGTGWTEIGTSGSGIFMKDDVLSDEDVTILTNGITVSLTEFNDNWDADSEAANNGAQYMGESVTITVEVRALQSSNVDKTAAGTKLATMFS